MKFINWILGLFDKIGKDKYQHFVLGCIIECTVFAVIAALLSLIATPITAMSIAISLAFVIVVAIECCKEYLIDMYPDPMDIVATIAGALFIASPIIMTLCLI